jgi:uncharacterized DUF497 family protein
VDFERDEAKRRKALEGRGLDFEAADVFFDGRPVIHQPTPRNDEDRWKTTAEIEGRSSPLCGAGEARPSA